MAANTFITNLIEECDKCRDFIYHSAIMHLRFERDIIAIHQILGLLYKDEVLEIITEMLKTHCLSPLVQGHDWSKWESAKSQRSWPSTLISWS